MAQIFAKSQIKSGIKKTESAQKAEGENADNLFQQAFSKFEEVIKSDSIVRDALHNWALALTSQARTKTGKEIDDLFALAYAKYAAAMNIAPNSHEVLNDWGVAMMDQARVTNPEPGNKLYDQAIEKFLAAEALRPGISAYNLACISSLRNDPTRCQEFLRTAFEQCNLPLTDSMKSDPDLSNAVQTEWFQEFVESIPKI